MSSNDDTKAEDINFSPLGIAKEKRGSVDSSESDTTDFVVTDEILANSYDDESTIAEEEELEEDDCEEIDKLKEESEMPIEELMRAYGIPPSSSSSTGSRGRTDPAERTTRSSESGPEVGGGQSSLSPNSSAVATRRNRKRNYDGELMPIVNQPIPGDTEDDMVQELEDEDIDGDYSDSADDDYDDEVEKESTVTSAYSGTRLWCKPSQGSVLGSSLNYDSEDDEDYDPIADGAINWKNHIRVGDSYQAKIAPFQPPSTVTDSICGEAQLLWSPLPLSEKPVVDYLHRYAEKVNVLKKNFDPDDEEALFLLMESEYIVEEALRRLKNKTVQPSDIPTYLSTWTESEVMAFERGIATYNKNFHQIAENKLKSKTVSEIVQFYYVWKKTNRHSDFMRLFRKDKKRHQVLPGITDYMDCVAMEQDQIGDNYLSGAWPGTSGPSTVTRQQLQQQQQQGCQSTQGCTKTLPHSADDYAKMMARSAVARLARGSWCPTQTSLQQDEVDRLIEERSVNNPDARGGFALSHIGEVDDEEDVDDDEDGEDDEAVDDDEEEEDEDNEDSGVNLRNGYLSTSSNGCS